MKSFLPIQLQIVKCNSVQLFCLYQLKQKQTIKENDLKQKCKTIDENISITGKSQQLQKNSFIFAKFITNN